MDEVEEALLAGTYGACNFCNKKGHFKKDCPDYKEKLLKIRKYKEGMGEKWISPKKYAEMKKAKFEKKAQNKDKEKGIFLTQSTGATVKTTKLYDENQMNDESEYDSYFTSYSAMAVEKDLKDDDPDDSNTKPVEEDGKEEDRRHVSTPPVDDHRHVLPPPVEVETLVSEKEAEILLLEENTDTAILDTGCARSASGEDWMKAHIDNLSQEDRLDIKRKEGKSHFRFGNGKSFKSKELLILPVYFGEHRAMMAIDVVEAKIPLIISLSAMKKANTVIKTATDTAIICGQKIKLVRLGGHYTLSLRKGKAEIETENLTDQEEN